MSENLPLFEKEIPYDGIDSFNVLSKSSSIFSSRVRVSDCTQAMEMGGMRKVEKGFFLQTIFIKRIDSTKNRFPYQLSYMYEEDTLEILFIDIQDEKIEEKKNTITFFINANRYFSLEFRFKYDFWSVVRILEEKNKVEEQKERKSKFTEIGIRNRRMITEDRVQIKNEVIKNYSSSRRKSSIKPKKKKRKNRIVKALSVAGGSTLATEKEELYLPLLNTPVKRWKESEMFKWFSQIPFHDKKNSKLISLYEYICLSERKIDFSDFFSIRDRTFAHLEKIILKSVDEPENDDVKHSIFFQSIKKNEDLIKRLYEHFQIMNYLDYEYKPSFYIILKKHLVHAFNSKIIRENPNFFNLQEEEYTILVEKKCYWSIRALRRKISFNFLFGMSIADYTGLLSREFKNYQKKNRNLKFLEALSSFNNLMGINLEDLSLDVLLQKRCFNEKMKWNELRDKKKQILGELRDLDLKKNDDERFQKIEKSLEDPKKSEKEKESIRKRLKKVKDRIFSTIEKKSKELNELLIKTTIKEKKAMKKYMSENPTKIMRDKKRVKIEKMRFTKREEYDSVCKTLIHEKLKRIFGGKKKKKKEKSMKSGVINDNKNDDIRLTSKLVLSRHQTKSIPFIEKFSMKVIKSFLNPKFFKFGFIHGYVIVCNVGFHFFGSGIVYVEDIKNMSQMMSQYEDLVCIDSHCQLISSYERFGEFLTEISRTVVDWNSNYTYSFAGFRKLQSRYVRNCQEFALSLLHKCLKVPAPFYPKIEKYIDDLTLLHNKKMSVGKTEDEEEDGEEQDDEVVGVYRYIRVTEDLPEEIRVGVCKGKSKVYFKSHKDLDLFVYDCLNICGSLEVDYPGLYNLLKGFDRSFWIQNIYRIFPDESNEPGKIAGKVICHFFRDDSVVE